MMCQSPSASGQWPGARQASLPTRGKPSLQQHGRRRVAAVFHEGEPFGIGDEVAVELDRADQRAMRRLLIVEMKAVVAMTNGMNALVPRAPWIARARRGGGGNTPHIPQRRRG